MRLNLTNAAPPAAAASIPFYASGTASQNWEANTGLRRLLAPTKQGANAASALAETSLSNIWDVALGQWVSAAMTRDGQILGPNTGDLTLLIARNASVAAANFQTRLNLYVLAGDGPAIRGVAGGKIFTTNWTTTVTAVLATSTLDPVDCLAGDRIVAEVGFRATNTVMTSYTGTMRYGGTDATDLANGDSGTAATTRSSWIDLPVDALFVPQPEPGRRLLAA